MLCFQAWTFLSFDLDNFDLISYSQVRGTVNILLSTSGPLGTINLTGNMNVSGKL